MPILHGWLPLLPVTSLPDLIGEVLADVVRHKGATAGSLDGCLTVDGSGVISDPGRIDEQFRRAWLLHFVGPPEGPLTFFAFDREVSGWLPNLGEVDSPPLLGSDLHYVVQHKQASVGVLDGWGGRILKLFQSPGLIGWLLFFPGLSWMVSGLRAFLMLILL